jgi:YesN/AraC family two-component response regulator
VTGRRINKLTTNKPNIGSVAVANEYTVFSTSIDDTPDPPPDNNAVAAAAERLNKALKRKEKQQSPSQKHVRHVLRLLEQQESAFLDKSIEQAEQEATVIAKQDKTNKQRAAIEANHKIEQPTISMGQRSKNIGYSISSEFQQAINTLSPNTLLFAHVLHTPL